MKTASVAHLEGAILGDVLTIVRGSSHFSIPATELGDLVRLVNTLSNGRETRASDPAPAPAPAPVVVAPPRPAAVKPAAAPAPAPTAAPVRAPVAAPVAAVRPAAPAPSPAADEAGARARRGRVWEGVRQFLAEQAGPTPFDALLRMVKRDGLTERDPAHALRIALGKKVSAGEIVRTAQGKYTLPEGAVVAPPAPPSKPAAVAAPKPAAAAAAAAAPKPAAPVARPAPAPAPVPAAATEAEPPSRKHRPGELWKQMRAYMVNHPEGLTRDQIIAATRSHGWTNADSVEHAVKICLSRVRQFGHIEETGGRWRLLQGGAAAAPATAEEPAPAASAESTIRRRKKQPGEVSAAPATAEGPEGEAPPLDPNADDSGYTTASGRHVFNASLYYPRPRTKRPR